MLRICIAVGYFTFVRKYYKTADNAVLVMSTSSAQKYSYLRIFMLSLQLQVLRLRRYLRFVSDCLMLQPTTGYSKLPPVTLMKKRDRFAFRN